MKYLSLYTVFMILSSLTFAETNTGWWTAGDTANTGVATNATTSGSWWTAPPNQNMGNQYATQGSPGYGMTDPFGLNSQSLGGMGGMGGTDPVSAVAGCIKTFNDPQLCMAALGLVDGNQSAAAQQPPPQDNSMQQMMMMMMMNQQDSSANSNIGMYPPGMDPSQLAYPNTSYLQPTPQPNPRDRDNDGDRR